MLVRTRLGPLVVGAGLALTPLGAVAAGAVEFSVPQTVAIPTGPFVAGSNLSEREAAYRLDEAAYGHSRTR